MFAAHMTERHIKQVFGAHKTKAKRPKIMCPMCADGLGGSIPAPPDGWEQFFKEWKECSATELPKTRSVLSWAALCQMRLWQRPNETES